jgi:hypothetical protein
MLHGYRCYCNYCQLLPRLDYSDHCLSRGLILTFWGLLLWLVFTVPPPPFNFALVIPLPALIGRLPLSYLPLTRLLIPLFLFTVLNHCSMRSLFTDGTTRIHVKLAFQGPAMSNIITLLIWDKLEDICRPWRRS